VLFRSGVVVAQSDGLDFALLRVTGAGDTPSLERRPSVDLSEGTELVVFACPIGRSRTRWLTRVAGPARGYLLDVEAEVPPHRGGGLVVDRFGRAVGIVTRPNALPRGTLAPHGAVLGLEPLWGHLDRGGTARIVAGLPDEEVY